MILEKDNWDGFKEKLKGKIALCDKEIEIFLLNEDVRSYIIDNDRNIYNDSLLIEIANGSSSLLREFYFSEEVVKALDETGKIAWVMSDLDYYPYKVQLFDRKYILDTIANYDYVPRKITSSDKKGEIVDKIINYYFQDISSYSKALDDIIQNLSSDKHEFYLKKYKSVIEEHAISNKNFSYDFLFRENDELEHLLKILEIFSDVVIPSYRLTEQLIESFSSYHEDKEDSLKNFPLVLKYLSYREVRTLFFNNCSSSIILEKLYKILDDDLKKEYLNDEGIQILRERNMIRLIVESDIDLDSFLVNASFLDAFNDNNIEYFHHYLKNIKGKVDKRSLENSLNLYLNSSNYEGFYKTFTFLDDEDQISWFRCNKELFINSLSKSFYVLLGVKKSLYNLFSDLCSEVYKNCEISPYMLREMLDTKEQYSHVQLEKIFTSSVNVNSLFNSSGFCYAYIKLLALDNEVISSVYLGEEVLKRIRENSMLKDIYDAFFNSKSSTKYNKSLRSFLVNEDNLNVVGEETRKDDEYFKEVGIVGGRFEYDDFFYLVRGWEKEEKDTLFKILDYFLINSKYLVAFNKSMSYDDVISDEYYESRRDLITKVIQEGDIKLLNKIFVYLDDYIIDKERMSKQIFPERERLIYSLDSYKFDRIFATGLDGKYRINEDTLDVDQFVSVFSRSTYGIVNTLKAAFDNEDLIRDIISKVKNHDKLYSEIKNSLGDCADEYKNLLKLIELSSFKSALDDADLALLDDMKKIMIDEDYKETVRLYETYKGVNLEKEKLRILESIRDKSRKSILSSLTDIKSMNPTIQEYTVRGRVYRIPTVVFDGEPFNFLVRRLENCDHYLNGDYKEKIESYSTIYEENRSMFYGNSGIKLAYSNVKPGDIVYVYPFDAISNDFDDKKYWIKGLKTPRWLSSDDLNRITRNNQSYNEIRIEGRQDPDIVVSYDEPDEQSILSCDRLHATMAKILRKRYPNCIESHDDPYKHWQ